LAVLGLLGAAACGGSSNDDTSFSGSGNEKVDGSGETLTLWSRMFWSILFPLVAPGLVATSVFSFIMAWNEFIFAITFMNDESKYTVAAGLRQFFTQYSTDWGAVMAGSTIITVPVMLFFVAVQRRLASGLAAGAVKG
jgi:N,N'-diacetylchitobiose transport system permease protein